MKEAVELMNGAKKRSMEVMKSVESLIEFGLWERGKTP